jgi:D-3-phosphoglycerate dehydrogenase
VGLGVKVLVADSLDQASLDRLRDAGHEVASGKGLQGAELASALDGCRALIIRSATRVTAEVLRSSPSLKVVVRAGSGLDNVDVAVARKQGVAVFNTPAANAVSVAELVFGLLIALERHIVDAAVTMRESRWEKSRFGGRELAGRRLSLVGFGRIGREVATRANAFGMSVGAYDPVLAAWPADHPWVRRMTLDEAVEQADVLSMHVPLTAETRGMIGAAELSRLPKGAIVVNLARGGLVDEAALAAALAGDHLRGAVLDVFSAEPPGELALLKLPNVIATPHLGASTIEAQRRAGSEAAGIVLEALAALTE